MSVTFRTDASGLGDYLALDWATKVSLGSSNGSALLSPFSIQAFLLHEVLHSLVVLQQRHHLTKYVRTPHEKLVFVQTALNFTRAAAIAVIRYGECADKLHHGRG